MAASDQVPTQSGFHAKSEPDEVLGDVDLTGRVLFVVGGEDASLSPERLAACDTVLRLPMVGFVPCYNLQAAVAAVALERLRQQARTAGPRHS